MTMTVLAAAAVPPDEARHGRRRGAAVAPSPTSGAVPQNKLAMVGLVFVVLLVLVAIFAPLIAPYAHRAHDVVPRRAVARPLVRHRPIGRDMFTRVVYGARVSLKIGILATLHLADHRRRRSGRSPGSSAASSTR